MTLLAEDPGAVGVVSVSEPHFNPRWVCVEARGGYLAPAFPQAEAYARRQDVPAVYRINATLYLWRRDFLLEADACRWNEAPHRMLVIPEERAIHIDSAADFRLAELIVKAGLVSLPWLEGGDA